MEIDGHAHTTFSDGSALDEMIAAAETAGLDGLGLTDHCIVTDDAFSRRARYDLVETYERRRETIDAARDVTDLRLYDAAEVSYVEGDESRLAAFLDEADFAYTIGSVHFAGPYDYTSASQYAGADPAERRAAVERYYDAVVALIESELFDVLGHLDLPERLAPLRRYTTRDDYERVAAALSDSRTVPEINAGRVHQSLGRVHPDPAVLDVFRDEGVSFVLGTDSHTPAEMRDRVPVLRDVCERRNFEPIGIASLVT
ncbi:PHP domain-containing protein [Haloarcula amylovorans]|uniref:PHP domain-containing protein n=1 Tax=Haloarcula amylovorans TaxID=2562280 RepID=UPI001076152F|nr:PHP domain-containing protein [Halomicroarcula amylolytica]